MSIIFATDFYKFGHHKQYPEGTELVYSTFTPRSFKHLPGVTGCVTFGVQHMLEQLDREFTEFFKLPLEEILEAYRSCVELCLGEKDPDLSHIEALWRRKELPLEIRALPEGTVVGPKTPILTVHNTDPEFYWLTNYLETYISCSLWKPCTTASIARHFRGILEHFADKTCDSNAHVDWQAHDFSMRGMSNPEDPLLAGMGHLLYFSGTDSVPAILNARATYGCDWDIGGSVPATEHSVMCAGGMETELETFERLLDTYPTGILSIVSDTWDLWKVITEYLPKLKDKILARDGKLVIRPDSGDPEKILCGDPESTNFTERMGVIKLLDLEFGSTLNSKGFKELNPKIGVIYGDSISPERAESILRNLKRQGYASNNIVFGVGSYTYQYITRDSLGFAMKATLVKIKGEEIPIFKDPITDDGVKKSLRGAVKVKDGVVTDGHSLDEIDDSDLEVVYRDGKIIRHEYFKQIRERARS